MSYPKSYSDSLKYAAGEPVNPYTEAGRGYYPEPTGEHLPIDFSSDVVPVLRGLIEGGGRIGMAGDLFMEAEHPHLRRLGELMAATALSHGRGAYYDRQTPVTAGSWLRNLPVGHAIYGHYHLPDGLFTSERGAIHFPEGQIHVFQVSRDLDYDREHPQSKPEPPPADLPVRDAAQYEDEE